MHVCLHACMYVCMYARMHVCIDAKDIIEECRYVFGVHACMHACMYVCMYVCIVAEGTKPVTKLLQ